MERKGIDVSKHQGIINWRQVAADGIQFAIVRVGYGSKQGTPTRDGKFAANIEGALAEGIHVGAYLYSYALDAANAKIEANFTLDEIAPYAGLLQYPVFYDIEDVSQKNLGIETISAMCEAYCNVIASAGWRPGVYASLDWVKNRINAAVFRKYDLWLAQWTKSPTYQGDIAIWQYSDSGRVSGISGNVDMNIAYLDYAEGETVAAVASPVRETLRRGSTGTAVAALQIALTALGYGLKADSVFGALTEAAVKKFQAAKGLVSDGIVGAKTHAALDKAGDRD